MSPVRIAPMRPRTVVLAIVAALVCSAPAGAQGPPAPLYEPAPAQELGTSKPSDGGRSTLLLSLAFVALAGAGVLAVLAIRRPNPSNAEVVDRALAALADGKTPVAEPVGPPARRSRRFRTKPVSVEPAALEPTCAWRPRVVASEAPLPAFGPGSHTGSPRVPPPPD
jgi:hypothetical protein